jgi:hypothetical protein
MAAAAVSGWMRLTTNFGIAERRARTCGSSSMPWRIMSVSISEKYAVMADAP